MVWGPGKRCQTCSGKGYGMAPMYRDLASQEDARPNKLLIRHIKVKCETCYGKRFVGYRKLVLKKSRITLVPCARQTWGYTYIGGDLH